MKTHILDIGCGFAKQSGAIGVDRIAGSQADVLADVGRLPLPFQNNCMDVLEHLPDAIGTMEELWRIGKPGVDVYISAPTMSSANLHNDPTHLRAFTSRSFDYFIEGEKLFKYRYSYARFEKVSVEYDTRRERRFYDRRMAALATNKPLFYESRLAFIYPLSDINFHLKVKK